MHIALKTKADILLKYFEKRSFSCTNSSGYMFSMLMQNVQTSYRMHQ